jgi:Tfp pilus assembly protein PilF
MCVTGALQNEQFEQAAQHYATALDVDASDPVAWYEFACICRKINKLGVARYALEEAIRRDPEYRLVTHGMPMSR